MKNVYAFFINGKIEYVFEDEVKASNYFTEVKESGNRGVIKKVPLIEK